MEYSKEDKFAAWLILQGAEQGRMYEIMAQNIASHIQVTGGDPFEEFAIVMGEIVRRVGELLQDDGSQIWEHLIPCGHQGDPLPWIAVEETDWKVLARDMVENDNNALLDRIPYYIRQGIEKELRTS